MELGIKRQAYFVLHALWVRDYAHPKLLNIEHTRSGTNWGGLAEPGVYTRYQSSLIIVLR